MSDQTPPGAIQGSGPIRRPAGAFLARNTIYSVLGAVLPLPVAVLTVPFLVKGLGVDRFGILTIAWLLLGYFGLFDMGVARAVTKYVAEDGARSGGDQTRALVSSALTLLLIQGLLAGLATFVLAGWLVTKLLNIPAALIPEAHHSIQLLALSVPVILLTTGARAILEAQHKFGLINLIKIPSSISTYLLPLLVLAFTPRLDAVVGVLVLSKTLALIPFGYYSWRDLPRSPDRKLFRSTYSKQLLQFGGWLSVGNLIGSLLTYMDRFFIGSILTMEMLSYYATPFDIIVRLFVIPNAMMAVVFPVFSAHSATDQNQLVALHGRAIKYILITMTIPVVILIALAHVGLTAWLNPKFALWGAPVLQILATTALVSSVARVPLAAIHALGRPDLPAKFYLVILPLVAGALYFITGPFGITGVALVLAVRLVLEQLFLSRTVRTLATFGRTLSFQNNGALYAGVALVAGLAYAVSRISNPYIMVAALALLLTALGFAMYTRVLDRQERTWLKHQTLRVARVLFRT